MLKRFFRHPRTLAAIAWLIGAYLAFVFRTTRWKFVGEEHLTPEVLGAPVIITFWHERLALMPMLWISWRRMPGYTGKPDAIRVLVSQHRDGQLIGAIIRRFDLDVTLGSTSRGGPAALRTLARQLREGDHVAITPDGPRGPVRQAAPGVAQLAALAGAPIVPSAAQSTRHRRLRTWDRMVMPLPFGRGVMVNGPPIRVPRAGWEDHLPAIEAALNAVGEQADAACQ